MSADERELSESLGQWKNEDGIAWTRPSPSPGLIQPLRANNPKFEGILQKMRVLHNKKSHDYARDSNRYSNFEEAAETAGTDVGTVFRVLIGIKLARIKELESSGKEANNESLQDSRIDLANYAALYASYYEKDPNPTKQSDLHDAINYLKDHERKRPSKVSDPYPDRPDPISRYGA